MVRKKLIKSIDFLLFPESFKINLNLRIFRKYGVKSFKLNPIPNKINEEIEPKFIVL